MENYVFEDDAVIIKKYRNTNLAVKAMQMALDDLYDWSQAWGFKVLTGKTVGMLLNKQKIVKMKKYSCYSTTQCFQWSKNSSS